MQTQQEYWAEVRETRAELERDTRLSRQQPKDGNVFIISIKNRERGTTAGSVVEARIPMAAERIVQGTHILATDDEVLEYKSLHAGLKRQYEAEKIAAKTQYVVNMTPVETELAGAKK